MLDLEEEKSRVSLDNPAFFNASFVVKLANILNFATLTSSDEIIIVQIKLKELRPSRDRNTASTRREMRKKRTKIYQLIRGGEKRNTDEIETSLALAHKADEAP